MKKNLLAARQKLSVATCRFLLACSLCLAAIAATTQPGQKNQTLPSWITMMDKPGVNYQQAVDAFEAFWKGRVTPIEENEMFETEGKKEKEEELRVRKLKKLSKDDPAIIYAFEYKRFKNWQREMASFVKADGRLMTMDERIAEWQQLRQQRKEQEFKPKSKDNQNKKN